jgi:pyruvate-formate lyase-activating enzyme
MSGGEATLQVPFVRAFFSEVKARSDLTTLIQTNGDVSPKDLEALLPVTDGFMVDLKAFDSTAHHRLTGQANTRVRDTIRFLSERQKLFQVRQVVVPNVNDSKFQATELAAFLMTVDSEIHLTFLRFRPHGARGIAATWESPGDDMMESMVAAAQETCLKHVDHSI